MGASNASVTLTEKPAARASPDDFAACRPETSLNPRYLFYCYTCGQTADGETADDDIGDLRSPYSWIIWRPGSLPALPRGLPGLKLKLRFLFRWAMDRLHWFGGPGCGVVLIYERERLVHYSGFTPSYWRFPFMVGDDFQIGDIWTHPAHRGRGLALFALQTVVTKLARPGRRLWYVVEAINEPSIRVAEKAQFTLIAEGTWVKPWGLKSIGTYEIRRSCSA